MGELEHDGALTLKDIQQCTTVAHPGSGDLRDGKPVKGNLNQLWICLGRKAAGQGDSVVSWG